MQVSVETGEGLERKLTVQIPAEKLEMEVENRLKSMRGRVKIDGFRPGKVPMKVVKQRYGAQVFQEVAGEIMHSSLNDALTQENLRPAGDPSISTSTMQPGSPLEYTATFEIYPEVKLNSVSELKLEKISAEVKEADVANMLETLRKQRANWAGADRPAENGDRITVSFKGKINGETFAGGTAENIPVIIGSGGMIPGFEDKLIGLSKGDETTIKVTFPEDYSAADLVGKAAEFEISVSGVEVAELPVIDEEFAKAFGIEGGDVNKLSENVKANMERELAARLRADLKTQVMEKLLEANPVDVPGAIVREEAAALKQQAEQGQSDQNRAEEEFIESAGRRVKMGMAIKLSAIQVDRSKVEKRIELMSKDYEDPDEFVRYYKTNPEALRGVETLVIEDAVADWVIDQVEVTTVTRSFDEVMNPTS
jgi:trigger factor